MAEVRFLSGGKELKGNIIGTDGEYYNRKNRPHSAMFDGDLLTYFKATTPDGGWAGLQLDTQQHVDSIIYIFRNDDNNVYPDQSYELFYFSYKGQVSLGRQVGTANQSLTFDNVPLGALLILRNHTKGREERPFMYERGKPVWW